MVQIYCLADITKPIAARTALPLSERGKNIKQIKLCGLIWMNKYWGISLGKDKSAHVHKSVIVTVVVIKTFKIMRWFVFHAWQKKTIITGLSPPQRRYT